MESESFANDFFKAGGALRPDAPSYVRRPADDVLFERVVSGEFCYILTPRQMGKSSLMVRTARRLMEQHVRVAVVDLTALGSSEISAEQWYLGLLTELQRKLKLSVNPEKWWQKRASLGRVQRFIDFLREVILEEIKGKVVIFIDEIDTTLQLNFTDDFFAAIRATYNARANDLEFKRLTFVLLGVATPSDMIKDRTRTPFNIGHDIVLQEFNQAEAAVLQEGLEKVHSGRGAFILARIFYWTNGHPYLTQKLCLSAVDKKNDIWTNKRVDEVVQQLFLSEEARRETNLQFVRDGIQISPNRRRLLKLYRRVYQGRAVPDDKRALNKNRLKLLGLVKPEQGMLKVRNEIYRQVFNEDWIKANIPIDWQRYVAVILVSVTVLLTGIFGYITVTSSRQIEATQAETLISNFRETSNPDVRVTNLSNLFRIPGFENQARDLFFNDLTFKEQIDLFEDSNVQALGERLIIIVRGLYAYLENNSTANQLLQAMAQMLRNIESDEAANIATEIDQWLTGRDYVAAEEFEYAVTAYNTSIGLNPDNFGVRFDRALAFVDLGRYDEALADLETVVELNAMMEEQVKAVIHDNTELFTYLGHHRTQYAIAALFPTLTPTATFSATPTLVVTSAPTFVISESTPLPTGTPTPIVFPTPINTPTPTLVAPAIISDEDGESFDLIFEQYFGDGPEEIFFLPDTTRLAYITGNSVRLLRVTDGLSLLHMSGTTWSDIMALSPRGSTIASYDCPEGRNIRVVCDKTRLQLYGVEEKEWLHTLKAKDEIDTISFSSNEAVLILTTSESVQLWRVADGTLLHSLEVSGVENFLISSDGEILALHTNENVQLWRVADGTLLHSLEVSGVENFLISSDGEILALHTNENVQLWRVADGTLLHSLEVSGVENFLISSDGEILALHTNENVQLWRVADGTLMHSLEIKSVNSMALATNGQIIALGLANNTIELWNVEDEILINILSGHRDTVTDLEFSRDGTILASIAKSGEVRLWGNDSRLTQTLILEGHTDDIKDVTFSPNGTLLASGSYDNTVRMWQVNDGTQLLIWEIGQVNSIAFSPDGSMLAVGLADKPIQLYRVTDGVLVRTLTGHQAPVNTIIFSPDGKLLVSGADDGSLWLWEVNDGKFVYPLEGHASSIKSVSFSPDGTMLASAAVPDYNIARLWNVNIGTSLHLLEGHRSDVTLVSFSPDGETLATVSQGWIYMWQVRDWTEKFTVSSRGQSRWSWSSDRITDISFSPDGTILAAGLQSGNVQLYWAVSGASRRVLGGHSETVTTVDVFDKGSIVASGSADNTIRIWKFINN